MNIKEVAFGIGDVIATNNLLDYLKPNEDSRRVLIGATLAGLGYALGPEMREKLQSTDDALATQISREHLVYAAGGAALGGFVGYATGNDLAQSRLQREPQRVRMLNDEPNDAENITQEIMREFETVNEKTPGGLVTALSTAWLGYTFLFAHHTPDFRERQLWGLGLGATGYLAGPELFGKIQDIVIPDSVGADVERAYSRGGMLFGGLVGAGLGIALKNYSPTQQYLPRGDQ